MWVSLAETGKKFQKNLLIQVDLRNSAKGILTILKASLIKFEFIINHSKIYKDWLWEQNRYGTPPPRLQTSVQNWNLTAMYEKRKYKVSAQVLRKY